MHIVTLRNQLRALGARPAHEDLVLRRWSQALAHDTGRRPLSDFMPRALRDALPSLMQQWHGLAVLRSAHAAADGAVRLLVDLHDGQSIETVMLPSSDGVCVSTQVGCAVGCVFCMTGQSGLLRQLGSAEIVAQVVLARQRKVVRKVVFMGMGEPAHNLDNVLDAIEVLGTLGNLAHKQLVFSTVGDARLFDRLAQAVVKPALAVSLHSTQPQVRAQLLPRAPHIDPAELVQRADAYARLSKYPVQYQWTLIEGVNDGADELAGIVRLLAGSRAVLNLIPCNAVAGLPYRRPAAAHIAAMVRTLHEGGVLTKVRHSAGQDVDAGCGQLRARGVAIAVPLPLRPVGLGVAVEARIRP